MAKLTTSGRWLVNDAGGCFKVFETFFLAIFFPDRFGTVWVYGLENLGVGIF